jgi:DNA-binding NarL/FixJ family response regulator
MRILIVDDEESTRFYLKRLILKKFGFKVAEASNGIEALDSIQKEVPDIVFLDISMPQMDGIECLRQIRRDPATDSLPVVIMTAHNDATTVNEFLQLGIFAYILKPFGYYQTFDKLKEILGGLKSRSQQKKEEKVEDKLLAGIKRQKIVLADSDQGFRTFFKQLLNNQFRIAEAKDEVECAKAALNTNPDIIIISDNLKTKNEVELIKKLRETNTKSELKIFLCRDINESFKTNQDLFDGVIQKSFLTDSFMREFSTKVLNYGSLFGYMQQIFKTYIQFDVISSIKNSLQLKAEKGLQIIENFDVNTLENKVLSKAELIAVEDDFVLNIGIVGDEPDAKKLVQLLKEPPNILSDSSHPHLNYICLTIASQIRLAIERYGIKTQIDSPAIKNVFLNTFYSYWEIVIPIKVDEKTVFVIGVNLEKKG